eukprot:7500970-Pyramimonas_sp.AAC.1
MDQGVRGVLMLRWRGPLHRGGFVEVLHGSSAHSVLHLGLGRRFLRRTLLAAKRIQHPLPPRHLGSRARRPAP